MKASGFLRVVLSAAFVAVFCPLQKAHTDNGYDAWLRYTPLKEAERAKFGLFPTTLVARNDSHLLQTAQGELIRGVQGMLGRTLRVEKELSKESAIVMGTLGELHSVVPDLLPPKNLSADGYWLANERVKGHDCIIIAGTTDRGTLYGVFALLRKIAFAEDLSHLQETQGPANPIRWVNEWDNLDGRIERGYGGRSIFFENGDVRADLTRASDYARLLASVGINGCVVNNVNANPRVLAPDFLPQLERHFPRPDRSAATTDGRAVDVLLPDVYPRPTSMRAALPGSAICLAVPTVVGEEDRPLPLGTARQW